jgi:hypothetical protein
LTVPLSDDEQRRLDELERLLSTEAPDLAAKLRATPRRGRLVLGLVLAVAGLALLVAGLVTTAANLAAGLVLVVVAVVLAASGAYLVARAVRRARTGRSPSAVPRMR